MDNKFKLKIINKSEIVFNKSVYLFTVNSSDGYLGVMRGREPMLATLEIGRFSINEDSDSKTQIIGYNSIGLIYVDGMNVKVFVDDVKFYDEIRKEDLEKEIRFIDKKIEQEMDPEYKKTYFRSKDFLSFIYNYFK